MPTPYTTARQLAAALAAGRCEVDALVERSGKALGKRWRWLRPLARRIVAAFGDRRWPKLAILAEFIANDRGFQRAWDRQIASGDPIEIVSDVTRPGVMSPRVGPPATWQVPALPTAGALAEWLEITPAELEWFADRQARERAVMRERLRHYRYRWVPKRAGGLRLIETPKRRLKGLQRRLLHGILDQIPPHGAAHGFRRGHSIRTFVMPHVRQAVVIRVDLRDFFALLNSARVMAFFLTAGYPHEAARLLAGLCTNSVPADVLEEGYAARSRPQDALRWPHLPQGAPTSPALANLCAYRLDCRLHALAQCVRAAYTRYADDLVFSGGEDFARAARRFHVHVAAIAIEEGFHVHHRKTRVMRRSVRQQVTGIVLNETLNVRRSDYDLLNAILHNCVRHGPSGQNRGGLKDFRAHLAGRIEHVKMLHPVRGARLRAKFEQITW